MIHPGLDLLCNEHDLVLTSVRIKPESVFWDDSPFVVAQALTRSGVTSLLGVATSLATESFLSIYLRPSMLHRGLCPADATTRNILRKDVRRFAPHRVAIARACAGFVDWLDQPDEDESIPAAAEVSQ